MNIKKAELKYVVLRFGRKLMIKASLNYKTYALKVVTVSEVYHNPSMN